MCARGGISKFNHRISRMILTIQKINHNIPTTNSVILIVDLFILSCIVLPVKDSMKNINDRKTNPSNKNGPII
jgi:type III secretory pathway component EscR